MAEIAAPTSTPAPSPNAAPPASSTPAPDARPEPQVMKQQTVGEESGMFKRIEESASETGDAKEKPAALKPDKPSAEKPAVTLPEKAKPAESSKPDAKPTEEVPIEKMAPKALRDAYEARTKRLKEVERERDEFKAKAESTKPQEQVFDPEKDPRWVKMKERSDKLEEAIKFRDYEQSSEFQEKYWQPYEGAYQEALQRVTSFKKVNADGEASSLTKKDFEDLLMAKTDEDAIEMANAWFPGRQDKTSRILDIADKVRELGLKATTAKREFKKNIAEREEKMKLDAQRQQQAEESKSKARIAKWQELNDAALKNEDTKEFYHPAEGDAKAREILARGFKDADRAFLNGAPLEDGDKQLSDEEVIALHAQVRNKAATYDHVIHRLNISKARVAELETKLKEFENSTPGNGESGAIGGGSADEDSMFYKIDRASVPGTR